jgi:hypothetical protein
VYEMKEMLVLMLVLNEMNKIALFYVIGNQTTVITTKLSTKY